MYQLQCQLAEYMYTIWSIIWEILIKNEFKIKKIMEIEMVKMGSEKVADPPEFTTLASGLLKIIEILWIDLDFRE